MSATLQAITIFLDSNVVFSALLRDSATRRLLVALKVRRYRLVASPYVRDEVRRNVMDRYPNLSEELAVVMEQIEIVPDAPLLHRVTLATADRPVLAAALACGADYLVTGNHRDFAPLYGTKLADTTIVSTPALARLLLKG